MDPDLLKRLIQIAFSAANDPSRMGVGEIGDQPNIDAGAVTEMAADFAPGIGDVKAAFIDAPQQFKGGQNVAGIISLLSAIPGGLGAIGSLLKKSRTAGLFRSIDNAVFPDQRFGTTHAEVREEMALLAEVKADRASREASAKTLEQRSEDAFQKATKNPPTRRAEHEDLMDEIDNLIGELLKKTKP